MHPEPPPLAYATPEPAADRITQVRRVYAWFALGYAVAVLLSSLVSLYSLWNIPVFGWSARIGPLATIPLSIPLAIGAALMLSDRPAGLRVVRVTALAMWAASTLSVVAWQVAAGGRALSAPLGLLALALLVQVLSAAFSVPALLFWLSFPLRHGHADRYR